MFGRRVSKGDQRVAAYGAVDELNAALGLVRTAGDSSEMVASELVPAFQKDLIVLMGELATASEDLERYLESGFEQVSSEMVDRLSAEVDRTERDCDITFKGWALPGEAGLMGAAFLDQARTICRRAEREVVLLGAENGEIVRYLNRLSDLLWLLARVESAGK
ncbi:MAG: cob(I)alamin adenosyltransferase [Verrucomicrobiales bacterium]|jgi:cob(I)alamin adenosyltransferase